MGNPIRVLTPGSTIRQAAATNPVSITPSGLQLPRGSERAFGGVLDDAAQVAPNPAPRNGAPKPGIDPGTLALDLTQIGLDIVGIFEPTPFADGANTLISIGRGDWFGAITSAAGIIPYVGDAAKLGKLGRWGKTVANAVEYAIDNPAARRTLEPALRKIHDALGAIPQKAMDALPKEARDALTSMKSKLDDFFSRGADDAAQAASRRNVTTVKTHRAGNSQVIVDGRRYNLPPGKTADDIPLADPVGDRLQTLASDAAAKWDPKVDLSPNERRAIRDAYRAGEPWRANLLQQQAKGRWVEKQVKNAAEAEGLGVSFSSVGLDARTPGGLQYDIMSGTTSNLDRHAKREPDELFRMITF